MLGCLRPKYKLGQDTAPSMSSYGLVALRWLFLTFCDFISLSSAFSAHGISRQEDWNGFAIFFFQEIFQKQDRTYVSCIGRQVCHLSHLRSPPVRQTQAAELSLPTATSRPPEHQDSAPPAREQSVAPPTKEACINLQTASPTRGKESFLAEARRLEILQLID